jgi:hypothetical protein
MSLIIFNKKQQVSPERFGVSLVAGALLLLLLGAVHGRVHNMGYMLPEFISADARLLFIALAVAIILAVIFLFNQAKFISQARAEVEDVVVGKLTAGMLTESVIKAKNLVVLVAIGNMLLIILGLICLVWQPITQGFQVIPTFGKIALSVIAILLPLNYAARLQIEGYLDAAPPPAYAFVWQKFTKVLYWVLIIYWAALFAAYVTLLVNSKTYCSLLMC